MDKHPKKTDKHPQQCSGVGRVGCIPECDRSTNKDKRHPASPGGVCLCCIDSSGIKSPSGTDGGISRGFDDYSRRRRIGRRLPATPRPAREDGVSQSSALRRPSGWRLPAPPRPARAIPPASTNTQSPNPYRLGFFLPAPPVKTPLASRASRPGRRVLRPDSRKFLSLLSVGTRALATPLLVFSMTYRQQVR